MTADTTIRPAEPGDFEQWLPLWQGYNAFYDRSGAAALPDAITHLTWSRFFDAYEPMQALVAERAGRLVGLAHYLFHRSTIAIAPSCYLQDLFTDASVRGQGIGGALIDSVADAARRAGASRLYWQTHETNLPVRALYDRVAERSGFIVYRKML